MIDFNFIKLSQYKQIFIKLFFVFCFIFITYLAFYQLGRSPLENWDEAWYADVTRNILRTKEFFVLYWNNTVWLDKPPLYMWLSAFAVSLFGFSELSFRLTSAVSGVIVVMLVAWFAYKNYGFVPSFLAFVTLALNNVFVWRMRSGNIDLLVSLLIFLVFLTILSKHKYKYYLLGLLFAGIFLTKLSLVVFPIIVFVLHEIFYERKNIIKNYKNYLKLILITCFIPAIWLLIGSMKAGISFAQYFIFSSDQGVATVNFLNLNKDYALYVYYSLQRRFFFAFVVGVLFAIRYIKDRRVFLMLLFGLGLLIQLSFTDKSNNWYLIPSMPFWSLLIAFGVFQILKFFKNNLFLKVLIIVAASVIAYRTYTINIIPIINTSGIQSQMKSGKLINNLTKKDETVVRLDHLYPTIVYYSDRRTLASPIETGDTREFWITREDLIKEIRMSKITWIIGKTNDIENFKSVLEDLRFKTIIVNSEESILQIL